MRIVILGAGGFISKTVQNELEKFKVSILPIPRKKIDLTKKNSSKKLAKIIKSSDRVFFAAAEAPVKNEKMLINNLLISKTVCELVNKISPSYLLYLSSDAVYSDSKRLLYEKSVVQPNSLHGIMHYAREVMLKNSYKGKMCIVRPTLIYGKNDPHNGYGPNRFIRLVKKGQNITLFGKGEELRDHIWVQDVAEIIAKLILFKKIGTFNLVTGKVISFKNIAKKIVETSNKKLKGKKLTKILYAKRIGPMPHGGWRAFRQSNYKKIFPNFKFKTFDEVLPKLIN